MRSFVSHPLVLLSVAAVSGSVAASAPGPALGTCLVWLLFAGQRLFAPGRRRVALGLCVFLFVGCGTRALAQVSEYQKRYALARDEIGAPLRCAGVAAVTVSPILRTRVDEKSKKEEVVPVFTAQAPSLDCEGRKLSGPLTLRLYGGPEDLARGDRLEFIGQLAPLRLFRNAALGDPWPGAARRGAVLSGSLLMAERVAHGSSWKSWMDKSRAQVRARINATYSPLIAPLGRALVLGESDLQQGDAEAFRQSGLLHLLAVSGTHLVIAVFALVQMLRALLVRILPLSRRYDVARFASACGAPLSLAYADFSGGSGSAWRAAFMLCVVCGGRALGFRIGGAAALGASLFIGLAVDPLAGADFSFLLSALATAGLIGIGQPLTRLAERGLFALTPLRQLSASFIATVASTVPCAPVLAMMDGDMTFAALFANVVAGPLGELIALPACLVHTLTSPFPALESGLATVGSGALYGVRAVALWSASITSARFAVPFPSAWNLSLAISLGLALCRAPLGRAPLLLLLFALSQATIPRLHANPPLVEKQPDPPLISPTRSCAAPLDAPPSRLPPQIRHPKDAKLPPALGLLQITALDVGQGDALFIDFPDGRTALMDGGGFATGIPDTGERVILPYLRARGIDRLDLVVLSHAHPDHLLGLLSTLAKIPTEQLWLPGAGAPRGAQLRLLVKHAKKHGARVRYSDELCQQTAQDWASVRLSVIAPCRKRQPPLEANDASLVLRLEHGKMSALLTGDLEARGETLLLKESPELLFANLLKVGHHGSHTSTSPAFLAAVSPQAAFISSGVRNRFEHPRPQTLSTLRAAGVRIFRTDRQGSLTWISNGRSASVRSFSAPL